MKTTIFGAVLFSALLILSACTVVQLKPYVGSVPAGDDMSGLLAIRVLPSSSVPEFSLELTSTASGKYYKAPLWRQGSFHPDTALTDR